MKQILIIDDDVEMCGLLATFLTRENFEVETVHNGEKGLAKVSLQKFHFVILDVMLPDTSGFEVLRKIRIISSVPVLMLTAKGDEIDRIIGLEIGADDYLPKPFSPRELVARMQAVLRRIEISEHPKKEETEKLIAGDLKIEIESRMVFISGKIVELTTAEFDVLSVLVRSAGKIVSRETLAKDGMDKRLSVFDRSIDMIISKIRQKIGRYDNGSDRIRAVRNGGYLYTKHSDSSDNS
jgi:two-component system, OmpR family, response regulator CpxR